MPVIKLLMAVRQVISFWRIILSRAIAPCRFPTSNYKLGEGRVACEIQDSILAGTHC